MTSTKVKHPILRLEVLAPDGTHVAEHRVFCRWKHKSVRVDDCASCVHCDAITEGSSGSMPSVDCTIPVTPLPVGVDRTGDRTEVATLLCTGTIVVAETATLHAALALLHAENRRAVAIVDGHHVLVGLVHETASIGKLGALSGAIRGAMSTAIAVHEGTPVRAALRMLAASHLREATVVSDEGTPLGIFRDVDGLRWIAVAHASP